MDGARNRNRRRGTGAIIDTKTDTRIRADTEGCGYRHKTVHSFNCMYGYFYIYPGWSKGYINRDRDRNRNRDIPKEGDKDRDRGEDRDIDTDRGSPFV